MSAPVSALVLSIIEMFTTTPANFDVSYETLKPETRVFRTDNSDASYLERKEDLDYSKCKAQTITRTDKSFYLVTARVVSTHNEYNYNRNGVMLKPRYLGVFPRTYDNVRTNVFIKQEDQYVKVQLSDEEQEAFAKIFECKPTIVEIDKSTFEIK